MSAELAIIFGMSFLTCVFIAMGFLLKDFGDGRIRKTVAPLMKGIFISVGLIGSFFIFAAINEMAAAASLTTTADALGYMMITYLIVVALAVFIIIMWIVYDVLHLLGKQAMSIGK